MINWILATLAAVTVCALLFVLLLPDSDPFSPTNRGWDGTSTLVAQTGATLSSGVPSATNGSYLLVLWSAPDTATQRKLRDFVAGGGQLVVFDDSGASASLLRSMGARIRVGEGTVVDPLFNAGDPILPLAGAPGAAVPSVVLDHPAPLQGADPSIALLASSQYSFTNHIHGVADYSRRGPFALAAALTFGRGEAVLVGDPGLVINAGLEHAANRSWLTALLGGPHPTLAQASVGLSNAGRLRGALVTAAGWLRNPVLLVISFLLVAAALLLPVQRRRAGVVLG